MKATPAVAAMLALFCVASTPSSARHGVNLILTQCPQSGGLLDGCALSPGGTYQQATFFTGYAQQSGQTWAASRPSWNVAGVDYPVGPIPGTVWRDPAAATLPSGCTYLATGSASSSPLVKCNYSVSPTFANFDFSGTQVGSHGAVLLQFTGNVSGTVTLANDMFGLDAASNVSTNGGMVSFIYPDPAALVVTNSIFYGHGDTLAASQIHAIAGTPNASLTLQYNAFVKIPGRLYSGGSVNSDLVQYNFVDGFMYTPPNPANSIHGEMLYTGSTGLKASVQYSYNTVLMRADGYPTGQAPIYVSNGGVGALTFGNIQIDHNIQVNNLTTQNSGSPNFDHHSMSNSLVAFGYNTYTNTSVTSNYVDSTGSFFTMVCQGSGTYPAIFTNHAIVIGNIDLVSGNSIGGITVVAPNCTP